jgi:acetyltransferase-like isoleucine patch superfamily enzyme
MRICLFEDRRAADLVPLTLTRPAFDLLCGLSPLAEKHARYFAPDAVGYLVRPLVADLVREARPHAPVNDPVWLRSGPTVLVNGRWVPPARRPGERAPPTADLFADGPFLAVCDGELAYAAVNPELLAAVSPVALDDCLEDWLSALPRQEVGGFVARRPGDLVGRNGQQIVAEFPGSFPPELDGGRPAGVAVVGPADRLVLAPLARVEPMVAIDTTGGPVVVADGASVAAFTRLEGPCYVGPGSHVLGGRVAGTSVGPHCRIGGEVTASILQGFADKPHDGFLGRSFVGEWAALAAGSVAGDSRTDPGPPLVQRGGSGCVIGDHTRVGPGVLLGGGSVVGAFARLLPTGRLLPRDVPSFTRVGPDGTQDDPNLDAHLAAADDAMRGRGRSLSSALVAVYRAVAAQTAAHRRRSVGGEEPARPRKIG